MSVASTRAPGRSDAMASAMAPQPVPRSATRASGPIRSNAAATNVSVSGLGIKTSGVTSNASPQNSRSPRM